MKTKAALELADLKAIAAAAEAEARANQWAVTIAIVDDGGHLLWLQRLDGAAPISAHIAPAKARTAAIGRRESRTYEEMINGGRVSFLSAPGIEGMPMARYGMRGTPTAILIDRAGMVREHFFSQADDLSLGAAIGALLAEKPRRT